MHFFPCLPVPFFATVNVQFDYFSIVKKSNFFTGFFSKQNRIKKEHVENSKVCQVFFAAQSLELLMMRV